MSLHIHYELPEGPVLSILMQDPRPWIDCCGCGEEFLADGHEVEYAEHTSDGGLTGYAPYCKPCYRKYIDPYYGVSP